MTAQTESDLQFTHEIATISFMINDHKRIIWFVESTMKEISGEVEGEQRKHTTDITRDSSVQESSTNRETFQAVQRAQL
jgi:hypothetical protein